MNLLEALRIASKTQALWVRPVSWRGSPSAYLVAEDGIYSVPDSHGGYPTFTRDQQLLLGEWDVLTPDELYEENDAVLYAATKTSDRTRDEILESLKQDRERLAVLALKHCSTAHHDYIKIQFLYDKAVKGEV